MYTPCARLLQSKQKPRFQKRENIIASLPRYDNDNGVCRLHSFQVHVHIFYCVCCCRTRNPEESEQEGGKGEKESLFCIGHATHELNVTSAQNTQF